MTALVRCLDPLLGLLQSPVTHEPIRQLIDAAHHKDEVRMPDRRRSLCEQLPQRRIAPDLVGQVLVVPLRQISLLIGKVTGSKEIFGGVGTRVVGVEKLRKSINRRAPLLVLAQLLCRAVQFRLGGRWLLLCRLLARI